MFEVLNFHSSTVTKQVEGLLYTVVENRVAGVNESTDLVSGKYEGGLKLWECSIDLIRYLKDLEIIPPRVLELGCGHGLPGIFCALKGSSVTFQDYNKEVIEYVTGNNAEKNQVLSRSRFCYGSWGDLSSLGAFDLVLTSETIYNIEYYESLLWAIESSAAKECLVACKGFYFGVGGSMEAFVKAAIERGFICEIVRRIEEIASTRFIIKLTKPLD